MFAKAYTETRWTESGNVRLRIYGVFWGRFAFAVSFGRRVQRADAR